MKKITLLLLLFQGALLLGQQIEFGKLTLEDGKFSIYEKDTTAHAVYLYEKGENYFEVQRGYIFLITKYHAKKKILDKQGFSEAEITIPYYHNEERTEKVINIRALTHNDGVKFGVNQETIYDADINERWSEKRFTFPNVQEGSILEYTYEIQSPFLYNLNGWDFQENIPKVYTEYNAKIPGNYRYNRALIGELKLDVNDATVQKNCFQLPNSPAKPADCEVLKYVMKDVPAFKEDEEYMLSPKNYRSRLEFELSEFLGFNGINQKFTKTWKDVDREFKSDRDIGGQLRKKNFFEKNVPLEIIAGNEDALTKANKIYDFVKNHYTWNEKFGVLRDNRVKQAFETKLGNVAEINITLINLLNAADIKTDVMMMSTRAHGMPKKSHPVMSDFNYLVAKAEIDGITYLLDATEKELPFGMLPYRCLNYYGRVMDFDGDSYWFDIEPEKLNGRAIRLQMELDFEKGIGSGEFDEISDGYEAIFKKEHLGSMSEEEYIEKIEEDTNDDFLIKTYLIDKEKSNDKRLAENYTFELENLGKGQTVYFNPFVIRYFKTNPFKVESRYYPVDFGFLRSYKYFANIKIPAGYKVKNIPEPVNIGMPDNSGIMRFNCTATQDMVMVQFTLQLKYTQYTSAGYAYIKEFFENAVLVQNKNFLVFEKE